MTRPDTIAFHPEQGWSLLCNGVIIFDDTGELLPDGRAVPPRRLTTSSSPSPPERASHNQAETPRLEVSKQPGDLDSIAAADWT